MHFLIGLILAVFGFFMVVKSEDFLRNSGRIDFFDKNLGTDGGSRLGYKLLGILLIFIGFLIFFNFHDSVLGFILGPLIRAGNVR